MVPAPEGLVARTVVDLRDSLRPGAGPLGGRQNLRFPAAIADEPINVGGAEIDVTVSVGAAMMTPNVRSADRLVSLADSAMMKASDEGGDTLELAATPSTPSPDPAR
jgi:GGDEF domain-containing protein